MCNSFDFMVHELSLCCICSLSKQLLSRKTLKILLIIINQSLFLRHQQEIPAKGRCFMPSHQQKDKYLFKKQTLNSSDKNVVDRSANL